MKRYLVATLLCMGAAPICGFQPTFRRPTSQNINGQAAGSNLFRQYSTFSQKPMGKQWMSVVEDANNSSSNSEELVEGRKILTMVGYRFSSLVYSFLGLFIIGKFGLQGGLQAASGPILAAGVSYVLEGAAVNDRLTSETFKRLNLFLAQFGSLWLVAALLLRKAGRTMTVTNPLVMAASAVTVYNSVRAWTYGVKGWEKADAASRVGDLISTIRKYVEVMFTINNFTGLVYLFGALLFSGLKIAKFIDLCQALVTGGAGVAVIPRDIFRIGVYSLLSAVLVTLKDGGDRNRLVGSSYVELNSVASFVLAVMGGHFYNLGSIALGAASAFLSFYTGTIGFLTFREKREVLL